MKDFFNARSPFVVHGKQYIIYRLAALEEANLTEPQAPAVFYPYFA
jgi:hypothetical protein